ncbi:phage tail sheath subtilisin-like domain-containing protein, partial [Morganella morganii]
MTVPFATIPQNLRTPLFFVEFDNSMANTATATQRTLLIGQMLEGAAGKDSIPERITSGTQAAERFGRGSMLHTEADAYFRNDTAGEVWVLPLADTESQTAAAGKLKITSAANDTGVISLYIAGIRVQMAVVATDTAEVIATGLAKVINRNANLPVTAAAETDTVILTAKNKGAHGNGIDIRLNYLGLTGGESTPSGFEMTVTAMTGGNGSPDLLNGLANLKDRSFDFIVNPYTDTASLDVVKTFLADRWAWDKQLYGHSYG